jgi:hypothetical protein
MVLDQLVKEVDVRLGETAKLVVVEVEQGESWWKTGMAEVANGVAGQNQSFDILVVCHVGWMPCVAFDRFAQI